MADIEELPDNVVVLSGAFYESDVLKFRSRLEQIVESKKAQHLELQLGQVESVSSALLSLLLCCVRRAEQVGCQLGFTGIPTKLYDMARVGGLETVLPLRD